MWLLVNVLHCQIECSPTTHRKIKQTFGFLFRRRATCQSLSGKQSRVSLSQHSNPFHTSALWQAHLSLHHRGEATAPMQLQHRVNVRAKKVHTELEQLLRLLSQSHRCHRQDLLRKNERTNEITNQQNEHKMGNRRIHQRCCKHGKA